MIRFLNSIACLMLVASATFQSANAAPLAERRYQFKTYGSSFQCIPGVPTNGHNYPVPTRLIFSTQYGASGIYYPTKLPLNNTTMAEYWSDLTSPACDKYADLLKAANLDGEVVQAFSEYVRRTGTGECFKTVREDLTVTVKGYKLTGAQEFAQPVDDKDCK